MSTLSPTLVDELLVAIHATNLDRFAANAAEPYVHADYTAHYERLVRLVVALTDGHEWLREAFLEALFDIVDDGLAWTRKVFADLTAEVADMQRTYTVEFISVYGDLATIEQSATSASNAADLVHRAYGHLVEEPRHYRVFNADMDIEMEFDRR